MNQKIEQAIEEALLNLLGHPHETAEITNLEQRISVARQHALADDE